jgi:hypothetical protein
MNPELEDYNLSDEEYLQKTRQWKSEKHKRKSDMEYVAQLLEILNMEPPEKFLEDVKVGINRDGSDRKIKYMPIDKVIFLLYRTFSVFWKKEVLKVGTMVNASSTVVRLHYKIPNTNIWLFHDGQGAKEFQVEKGSPASALTNINYNAVMLAFPSSGSYALSNAAAHLGNLFGLNLNRKNPVKYMGFWNPDENEPNTSPSNSKTNGTKIAKTNNENIRLEDLEY